MGAEGSAIVVALSLVLMYAGASKLRHTDRRSHRLVGCAELMLGLATLLLPGRVAAVALAFVFLAFTFDHARRWRSGAVGCDCLGAGRAAMTSAPRAAAITGWSALVAVAAAVCATPSVLFLARDHTGELLGVIAGGAATAGVWWLAFTAKLPEPNGNGPRIVEGSARVLERRLGRRTLLQDAALVGSALAVAPLQYLLRPISAMAAIRLVPSDCNTGLCTDGYTEFCCEINDGLNACPEGTFAGGWWMCTDYAGRRLCSGEGVRYYVDCNALPGTTFPGGCQCGQGDCNHRRVACNVFRYGQCNTQIAGLSAVVCRMVLCENPSTVAALHCSPSLAVDDAVCGHDAACLEPPALELAGAGGV